MEPGDRFSPSRGGGGERRVPGGGDPRGRVPSDPSPRLLPEGGGELQTPLGLRPGGEAEPSAGIDRVLPQRSRDHSGGETPDPNPDSLAGEGGVGPGKRRFFTGSLSERAGAP